ncbi:MAG: MFS transporter [Ktedonobacteraceae bacterium]|nr:MFS transporter [Ktedonobacteraceae bacterium]
MSALSLLRSLNRDQRNIFLASFLGWTLDAFDFFLVTFVVLAIAKDFGQSTVAVTLAITITLLMRPIGALIFGMLAERYGRRLPLMIDILFYSLMELLTAFSPNFTIFFILRALFGIGMGGEWGIGASLAMESLPTEARGLFSGILQQGYACGYLLAAVVFSLVFPHFGWRGMFFIGTLPALLVLFIRLRVPESPVWQQQHAQRAQTGTSAWQGIATAIGKHSVLFVYVILLMTAFNFMSHGTQDLYPTFVQKQLHFSVAATSSISIIANIGAIIGGTIFGYHSQRWGRRRAISIAALLGLLMIPLWTGFLTLPGVPLFLTLALGAFLLQFMVQGAWGVIPVHLNELSPSDVRGTFPGFAYQIGNVAPAFAVTLAAAFAESLGTHKAPNYALAQAILTAIYFIAVIFLTAIGREARGIEFTARSEAKPVFTKRTMN